MKYYNALTKNQTWQSQSHLDEVFEIADDNPFMSAIPKGQQLTYDANKVPNGLESIPSPPASVLLEQKIAAVKMQRDLDMEVITIVHNSEDWSFTPASMSRFESKIARNRDFMWKTDDGSHVTLSRTQANNIAKKVDDIMTKIFFDAEDKIAALNA